MAQVRWTPQAADDLDAIAAFISHYYLLKSCSHAEISASVNRKSLKPKELGLSQRRQDRKGQALQVPVFLASFAAWRE